MIPRCSNSVFLEQCSVGMWSGILTTVFIRYKGKIKISYLLPKSLYIISSAELLHQSIWRKESYIVSWCLSLSRLSQKYPTLSQDVCLYSKVMQLLSTYYFKLNARRFIQAKFEKLNFATVSILLHFFFLVQTSVAHTVSLFIWSTHWMSWISLIVLWI